MADLTTRLAAIYAQEVAKREKDPDSEYTQISKLAWAGTDEEAAYYDAMRSRPDNMVHDGMPIYDAEKGKQSKHTPAQRAFLEQMRAEYAQTYGYAPKEDDPRVIAAVDGFSASGKSVYSDTDRPDLYARMHAAHDGSQENDGRTAVASGNRMGGRADLGPREESNDDWLRGVHEMQYKAGLL